MKRLWTAGKKWWKRSFRKLRRVGPLFITVVVAVFVGLAVPLGVLFLLAQPDILAIFGLGGADSEETPQVRGLSSWQKVLMAGGVVTLSAAIAGLAISYRRQRDAEDTKTKTEFANAAAQLGSTSASMRIAGVYAMAAIADSKRNFRQQCIDVLCGHMRLPYNPSGANHSEVKKAATRSMSSTTETDTYTFHQVPGEGEVRLTIIRVIRDHLQPDADISWSGCDFDFTGTVFDGGDFSSAQFTDGNFSFRQAKFMSGNLSFVAAKFSGRNVDFHGAMFVSGSIDFSDAKFISERVKFSDADFSGGTVKFVSAQFSEGLLFWDTHFSGSEVWFDQAKFPSVPSGGSVSFANATFSAGSIVFNSLFSGGNVSFFGSKFIGGKVDFQGAIISGGHIDFEEARFAGTDMRLNEIESSGGQIIFTKVREWKVPPKLPNPLPGGIHLPAHLNAQQ